MMKYKMLILAVIVYFSGVFLNAQETKPMFVDKTNQHSISAEFVAISYSYAHKFKPNVTFGTREQVGMAWRYLLTNPYFYYDCAQCPEPVWQEIKSLGVYYWDIVKLQVFYRSTISEHFYYDVGSYV